MGSQFKSYILLYEGKFKKICCWFWALQMESKGPKLFFFFFKCNIQISLVPSTQIDFKKKKKKKPLSLMSPSQLNLWFFFLIVIQVLISYLVPWHKHSLKIDKIKVIDWLYNVGLVFNMYPTLGKKRLSYFDKCKNSQNTKYQKTIYRFYT